MTDAENEPKRGHVRISPGEVSSKEDILLAVVEPVNWENGTFNGQAFQKKRLKARDQSVARQCYSTPRRLKFFVFDLLLRKPGRVEVGVQRFNSRALRELIGGDGVGQFVVVDAPLVVKGKIDFAHAHIGFSDEVSKGGNNVQAAAILNLRDLLARSGGVKKSRSQFPPAPFLYLRASEFRLARHKLRVRKNGEEQRFLEKEAARDDTLKGSAEPASS